MTLASAITYNRAVDRAFQDISYGRPHTEYMLRSLHMRPERVPLHNIPLDLLEKKDEFFSADYMVSASKPAVRFTSNLSNLFEVFLRIASDVALAVSAVSLVLFLFFLSDKEFLLLIPSGFAAIGFGFFGFLSRRALKEASSREGYLAHADRRTAATAYQ